MMPCTTRSRTSRSSRPTRRRPYRRAPWWCASSSEPRWACSRPMEVSSSSTGPGSSSSDLPNVLRANRSSPSRAASAATGSVPWPRSCAASPQWCAGNSSRRVPTTSDDVELELTGGATVVWGGAGDSVAEGDGAGRPDARRTARHGVDVRRVVAVESRHRMSGGPPSGGIRMSTAHLVLRGSRHAGVPCGGLGGSHLPSCSGIAYSAKL